MFLINDISAVNICDKLIKDVLKICEADNSLKFFRKDFASRTIWLLILKAYFEKKEINIEMLSRAIAKTSIISKPTLRLILDNAMHKGYLKFVHSEKDRRSTNIELEDVTIKEFKEWCSEIKSIFK
jgi:DNA-binding MarR family transcriptional regulator